MMLSPGAIGAVSEILDASDFYRESHAKIYRAALALYAKGEPVDAITLTDELEERSELEGVGGRVRLHELAALVPATANASHYARIVRETATLRGLIRAGGEIARLGWERPGEAGDLVDRAEQVVFDLSQQRVSGEFTHIDQLLKESFERITALYEAGVDVTGVTLSVEQQKAAEARARAEAEAARYVRTTLEAVGLSSFARRLEEWGAVQAVERLNLDGLLALWHPPIAN
jgi:replicative DNA helicase